MNMLPWFYHTHKIILTGWAIEPLASLELSFWPPPPPPCTLFSQIPYVWILHSSALRENFGGHRPNVFYYLLLNQDPTVRKFKHLMFSTAAHTGRGDTSSGLCVFLIWMYYSWHIHIRFLRRASGWNNYMLAIPVSLNPRALWSCPHKHMQIFKSSKCLQSFKDVLYCDVHQLNVKKASPSKAEVWFSFSLQVLLHCGSFSSAIDLNPSPLGGTASPISSTTLVEKRSYFCWK